jgi:hypothetical protein
VYQLRALVETTLLLDLGFTEAMVDAAFDRVRRYEEIDHMRNEASKRREAG